MRPTISELRAALAYDPLTGLITRRAAWGRRPAGSPAGGVNKHDGYVVLSACGVQFRGHVVAWALSHGEYPAKGMYVDHINGCRHDNRLCNLRLVTPRESARNVSADHNAKSPYVGVYPSADKWAAQIRTDNGRVCLGTYATQEEAFAAYLRAKAVYHGEGHRYACT